MSVERDHRWGGWVARYRDEQERQRSRKFERKADAEEFEREMRRAKAHGTLDLVAAGRQRLADYWAGAFADHLATKSEKTQRDYAHSWGKHIEPRLGRVPLGQLRLKRVRRFQADLRRDGVKSSAADKAMSVLSAMLGLAEADELIASNPVPKLKRKRPKARVVRPLTAADVEALRALLLPRDAIVVSLLAYSGIRPHELRALRWHAILTEVLSVPEETKTDDRPVRLLSWLKRDLAEWFMRQGRPGQDEFVVSAERDHDGSRQWSANGFEKWQQRVLKPVAAKIGRPELTAYHLRHTFASLLAHEGRSAVYIAEQLGHGPDVSVRVYQHVIREYEHAPRLAAEDAIRQAREGRARKLG
jgi:integrase